MTDNKISDLPINAALTDSDLLELEQPGETAGTRSRKSTLATLLTWIEANISALVTTVNGASGVVVLDDGDVKSAVTALTSGTTVTVDCSLGRNFTLTLGHNVGTLTLSNLAGSGFATEIEIEIKQDATGGRTFALPAAFKALGGSDTAIASAANAVTVLSAKTFDNGTTWRYVMQESG